MLRGRLSDVTVLRQAGLAAVSSDHTALKGSRSDRGPSAPLS
jgi:hypothetical protein